MKSKSWWHIRRNNKTKHGALIVDEDTPSSQGKYSYMDITTHPAKGEGYIKLDKPIGKNKKNHLSVSTLEKTRKRFFPNGL